MNPVVWFFIGFGGAFAWTAASAYLNDSGDRHIELDQAEHDMAAVLKIAIPEHPAFYREITVANVKHAYSTMSWKRKTVVLVVLVGVVAVCTLIHPLVGGALLGWIAKTFVTLASDRQRDERTREFRKRLRVSLKQAVPDAYVDITQQIASLEARVVELRTERDGLDSGKREVIEKLSQSLELSSLALSVIGATTDTSLRREGRKSVAWGFFFLVVGLGAGHLLK